MSQVNLLPPELRQRQAIRRTTTLIAVAGVGVIALIGIFYFIQAQRLSNVRGDLRTQQAQNAQLRSEIGALQPFADLQQELATREALVGELYTNEISWSSVLLDVSRVIPDASYLTNMTGQISGAAAVEGAPEEPAPADGVVAASLIGNMTFQGIANQTETIAAWLTRLEQVEGWVNAWVSSAQENGPRTDVYTFSSGLDLTFEATTDRGRGTGGVAP